MPLPAAKLAALRGFGPFPSLQVVPSKPDGDDLIDLLTNPAKNVTVNGPVAPLTYHGGPTLASPKLVALYSGPFYLDRAKNDQFLQELMAYGYLAGLAQQGSGNGRFLGSFDVPATAAAIADSDVQTLVQQALAQNSAIPRPDGSTIYMVILGSGVTLTDGGQTNCNAFCGYHSSIPNTQILYTAQTTTTCRNCNAGDPFAALTAVEAHEVAETCSDPYGTGWYNDQSGMENADECAWVFGSYGPWSVQGYAALVNGQWVDYIGTYTPVSNPQPQPQPQPQFVPDPNLSAWLAWFVAAAQYVKDQYAQGNVAAAAAYMVTVVHYAPWLQQYLSQMQGQPGAHLETNDVPPPPAFPPPVATTFPAPSQEAAA